MTIRKVWSSRVDKLQAPEFVGQKGTIFFNEPNVGQTTGIRVSDGTTPGGVPLEISPATPTTIGGVRSGPGVNISDTGLLTIDSAGLPISFGDFYADTNNLATVNANQNFNILSNGTGTVNVVGDFHIHKTSSTVIQSLNSFPVFGVSGDGITTILVPTTVTSSGGVEIIGNDAGVFQSPVNTGVMLHITGNDPDGVATPSRIYNDGIAGYSGWIGRRFNGSASTPTPVVINDEVMRLGANAYTGVGWNAVGSANIRFISTDNQGVGSQGMKIDFYSTPQGSGTGSIVKVMTIDGGTGVTASQFNGPVVGNVTGNLIGTANSVTNAVTMLTAGTGIVTSASTGSITVSTTATLEIVNSWTPGLIFANPGTGVTYSSRTGNYIKIGHLVHAYFSIALSGKDSVSGATVLTGLPFISSNNPGVVGTVSVDFTSSMVNEAKINGSISGNTTTVSLYAWTAPAGNSSLTFGPLLASDLSTSTSITGVATYISV